MIIKGIIPALCTPIDEKEKVNENSLKKLIDYTLNNGCHGIFILSSTGEAYALSEKEKVRAIKICINYVNGKVPVIVGINGIGTKEAIRMVKIAEKCGAKIVSILTPTIIKPNDEELYEYYKDIAESTSLNIILYNNPNRTGVTISPNVLKKLLKFKNIIAIKDSSGDLGLTMSYIETVKGTQVNVLCGNDLLIAATILYGGSGAITATANIIPKLVVELYNNIKQEKIKEGIEKQYQIGKLRRSFKLASWPSVTKDALNILNFNVGKTLSPIKPIDSENLKILKSILNDIMR